MSQPEACTSSRRARLGSATLTARVCRQHGQDKRRLGRGHERRGEQRRKFRLRLAHSFILSAGALAARLSDGVTLLDVAGPAEVFKEANRFGADYRIMLLSPTGVDVMSNLGVRIARAGSACSQR